MFSDVFETVVVFSVNIISFHYRISLNIMTLIIESPRIYTRNGVPITVTGVAQVKICSDSKIAFFAFN